MTDGELRAEVDRLRELVARRERDFLCMASGLQAFVTHSVHDIRSSPSVVGSCAGLAWVADNGAGFAMKEAA